MLDPVALFAQELHVNDRAIHDVEPELARYFVRGQFFYLYLRIQRELMCPGAAGDSCLYLNEAAWRMMFLHSEPEEGVSIVDTPFYWAERLDRAPGPWMLYVVT